MFVTLLLATFVLALGTSFMVERQFRNSVSQILEKIVGTDLSLAWQKYISFSIYVIGVSGGVPISRIESYLDPSFSSQNPLVLNWSHWALEVYRTILYTLENIALMLLAFFAVALIAYVVVRGLELHADKKRVA